MHNGPEYVASFRYYVWMGSGVIRIYVSPIHPRDIYMNSGRLLFTARSAVFSVLLYASALAAGTPAQAQIGPFGEGFGWSVAVSGDYAAVGEPTGNLARGAVIIYRRNPTTNAWEQQVRLSASEGHIGDGFGSSVDLSGDRAIVGVPEWENGRGAA
jgi:hypothetical protein